MSAGFGWMRGRRGLRQRESESEETSRTGSPAETEKAQGIDRTGDGGKTHSNDLSSTEMQREIEGEK